MLPSKPTEIHYQSIHCSKIIISYYYCTNKNIILKNNFIFGCVRSSLVCELFSSCSERGLLLCCGMRSSSCGGCSCCRGQRWGVQTSAEVARGLAVTAHRPRGTASVVVAQGLSRLMACGIFPAQG